MSHPDPPTLAEIEQALKRFNDAVDAEDVLAGTVHAAVCTGILERLSDCLRSGEYALVSREDRIQVLVEAEYDVAEARRLLQLETP